MRTRPLVSAVKRLWFELVALGLLALGVFLLVENLQIKKIMRDTTVSWAQAFVSAASSLWDRITPILPDEMSDVVGIALVVIALFMIALSIRWRAMLRHGSLPFQKECPECHEDLHRMPRRLRDRLLEVVLWIRIRRYRCSKCPFRASVWKTRGESE